MYLRYIHPYYDRAFSVLPSHHDTLSYCLFGAHMCQSLLKQHVLALLRMNMRRQTSDVKLINLSARKTIQIIVIVLLHLLKTHVNTQNLNLTIFYDYRSLNEMATMHLILIKTLWLVDTIFGEQSNRPVNIMSKPNISTFQQLNCTTFSMF